MYERLFLDLMFDFYGELLTDRQREIYDDYYGEDLSFQEIGENLGITKQAASDMLKRTEKQLYKYEDKIGAVDRYISERKKLRKAVSLLDKGNIADTKKILEELLEEKEGV